MNPTYQPGAMTEEDCNIVALALAFFAGSIEDASLKAKAVELSDAFGDPQGNFILIDSEN